jgi:uncharacterized protein (DUF934 family)
MVEDGAELPVSGRPLLSLKSLQQQTPAGEFGLWLNPSDEPAEAQAWFDRVRLIAVRFPVFSDGRGYSTATLLRRLGWQGELRAVGDVLRDQLFYLSRVGFNSFAIREDRSADDALAGLNDFSERYQGAVDQPLPLFRRRA